MLEEEFELLLKKEWEEEEKAIIERMLKNVVYYKKFIPKSLKEDIKAALQLCNRLKEKFEDLQESRLPL